MIGYHGCAGPKGCDLELHGAGARGLTRKKQRESGKGPSLKEGVKEWRVLLPEKGRRENRCFMQKPWQSWGKQAPQMVSSLEGEGSKEKRLASVGVL